MCYKCVNVKNYFHQFNHAHVYMRLYNVFVKHLFDFFLHPWFRNRAHFKHKRKITRLLKRYASGWFVIHMRFWLFVIQNINLHIAKDF